MASTNSMSDSSEPYRALYDAAAKLFESGQHDACLALAKQNLDDLTLPPYYIIKNCILIACALDDWNDTDVYRLTAEQAYITAFQQATAKEDVLSLEALEDLRDELDQLEEFRKEDLTAMADAQVKDNDDDMMDDAGEEDEGEYVTEAEAMEEMRALAEAEKDRERNAAEGENEVEEADETALAIHAARTEIAATSTPSTTGATDSPSVPTIIPTPVSDVGGSTESSVTGA